MLGAMRALGLLVNSGPDEVASFCLDDNYGWDDGLICGGAMDIFVQSFDTSRIDHFKRVLDSMTKRDAAKSAVEIRIPYTRSGKDCDGANTLSADFWEKEEGEEVRTNAKSLG